MSKTVIKVSHLGDLPLKERSALVSRQLWFLSYPTMISFALEVFYDIVDMAWVGRISPKALAGVTLFSTVYFLFTFLNDVVGTSSFSMISQAFGRGDEQRTKLVAEQTISFKVVLALVSAVLLLLFTKPILNLYTNEGAVINYALEYGYLRILFLPLMFASYSVNTVFRCTGDAKTPMRIMIITAILNIVLDPIFIFATVPFTNIPGLNLGVFGAALATVISHSLGFFYGFYLLLSGRKGVSISFRGLFKLIPEIDKQLLSVGLPSGIELLLRQAFGAVLMGFVAFYGTTAVAVAGVGGKLFHFGLLPVIGLSMGGSSLVGQYLGSEDVASAGLISKISVVLNVGITALFALGAGIFARSILSVFNSSPEFLAMGTPLLRIIAVTVIVVGATFGFAVVFSGSGLNWPMFISGVVSRWLVQLPLLYFFVKIMALPLAFVWFSYFIADAVSCFIIYLFYKKGAWKYKRV